MLTVEAELGGGASYCWTWVICLVKFIRDFIVPTSEARLLCQFCVCLVGQKEGGVSKVQFSRTACPSAIGPSLRLSGYVVDVGAGV